MEKLHTLANKIGYPDKWRDYSALTIARDDYMGNVLRARDFEFNRQIAKIGKPVDRGEWGMTPPTVNAYYNPQINDINFPAGILQPPFFDPSADDAPNYGDTGATIGHELTHGFDDEGRQFDAQGNLRDWWTAEDGKQFDQRASCISDQYSQYVAVDDIKINGQLTMGENVADLGGLMLAYMAWKTETQRPEAGTDRRLHSRAALLHRLRTKLVFQHPRRNQTHVRHHRPPLTRQIPRQRRRFQHSGISAGLPVQSRFADGAAEKMPSMVGQSSVVGLQSSVKTSALTAPMFTG